ncbi:MAG TPA: zinc ribbon domain-containing protein [Terriglobia bacterium]|nr:zinc ribbon domain-containing protein [Terriglobia bacterium]
MYCAQCGTQVQDNQKYCNRCGQPVGASAGAPVAAPLPPAYTGSGSGAYGAAAPAAMPVGNAARSRVACHLRTLGILWIVVSAMRLLPALGLLAFSHMGRMDFPFVPSQFRFFMMPMLGGLGVFLSATAVIGLAAGWGLLDRRLWARMLAIVIGCLSLLSFPFGTALGIYTLWVLASAGADVEYERLAGVV